MVPPGLSAPRPASSRGGDPGQATMLLRASDVRLPDRAASDQRGSDTRYIPRVG